MIGSTLLRPLARALGYAPAEMVTALETRSKSLERRSYEVYSRLRDEQSTAVALRDRVDSLETRTNMLRSRNLELQGTSGVPMNYGTFKYEQNRTLQGSDRWATIDKMRNDPAVDETLWMPTIPLYGGEWKFKPTSKSARDVKIADFCNANLLCQRNENFGREYWCKDSWKGKRLPEILEMRPHGFSMFALGTDEVNGMTVFDRIQWLEPQTVDPSKGWDLEKQGARAGYLNRVFRTFNDTHDQMHYGKPLEARQLALYTWNLRGERFEGRPSIRPMYSAWFRKDFVQRMAVIWAQKVGAPAPYGSYPTGYTPEQRVRFESFVQQLVGTAPTEAFGVFPQNTDGNGPEIKFAGSDVGEVDRMGGIIASEDHQIAKAGGTMSRTLGESSNGSRALGQEQSDQESVMPHYIASVICEYENNGCGGIPGLAGRLTGWNFGNADIPELVCENIDEHENLKYLEKLLPWVIAGIVPKCPELARAVTKPFNIEIPDDVFDTIESGPVEPKPTIAPGADPNAQDEPADEKPKPDAKAALAMADRVAAVRSSIAPLLAATGAKPAGKRRGPTVLESEYLRLADVSHAFDHAESRMESVLRSVRSAMVSEIARRITAGKITARSIGSQLGSNPRGEAGYVASVRAVLAEAASDGRSHVRAELGRMRGARNGSIAASLAHARPSRLEDALDAEASLAVRALWSRMLNEGIGHYSSLARQGLPAGEIAQRVSDHLDGLSETPETVTARQSSGVAYGQGRSAQLVEAKKTGEVEFAIWTEVMDNNTCSPCWDRDLTVTEIGSDEFDRLSSKLHCDGGDNCRGVQMGLGPAIIGGAN